MHFFANLPFQTHDSTQPTDNYAVYTATNWSRCAAINLAWCLIRWETWEVIETYRSQVRALNPPWRLRLGWAEIGRKDFVFQEG